MIVTCPKCKTRYRLKDDTKAAKVRCKKCQTIIQVKPSAAPEEKPQRAEMKTVAPEAAEKKPASRAEMKTAVPTPPEEKPQRAEMKTVAPEPAEEKPASRAEMKTVAPGGEAKAQQRAEMKTAAPSAPARPAPGVQPEEPGEDPLIGRTLGGYEVLKKLGEGGMGAVYEARQIALDRSVALKVLPAHLAANKTFITRFSREALSVARLNHTNIVQIYDIGKSEGTYFFSMEYVRGTTLGDMIEKQGKMDPAVAAGYILQAVRGIESAHRKNIIHRDIKPDNIMVNEEDIAKVADLGLAKQLESEEMSVTMSGVGMGTPVYMSPEQGSDAKNVDARADIYSLGCTLYHLITGRIPFDGSSAYEIITKHVSEPLTVPHEVDDSIPEDLSRIVEMMLAKKKEERYQSMPEIIQALEEYLGVDAQAGFEPSEAHINTLREHAGTVEKIQSNKIGRLVSLLVTAAAVLCGIIAVGKGSPRFFIAVVLYAVTAPFLYFILSGSRRKTYLYRRVRKLIFGNKISDWVTMVVVALVLAVLLLWLMPGQAIAAAVLAVVTAAAYFWGLKRPVLRNRDAAVEEVKKLARDMRRKGASDEIINLFVCRHGGKVGELICEEMVGYDAVLAARAERSREELEKAKRSFGDGVREWLISRIDAAEARRESEKRAALAPKPEPEPGAATATDAEKTAAMDAEAQAQAAAEEEYIAEIIEERKPGIGSLAAGIPKFILGAKGRVTVGAVMVLLAVLCLSGKAFQGNAVLSSYNFAAFGVALLFTGFAHSKAMLAGLLISCLISGPVAVYAARQSADAFLRKPLPFLGEAEAGSASRSGRIAAGRIRSGTGPRPHRP